MKILKQDTKNMRTHICTNCNSEIGYWANDLELKEDDINNKSSIILTCPVCGRKNILHTLSETILNSLRYRRVHYMSDIDILLEMLKNKNNEAEKVKNIQNRFKIINDFLYGEVLNGKYDVSFIPYYDTYRDKTLYVEVVNTHERTRKNYFITDIKKYMEHNNYKNYYIFTKDEYILLPK